VRSSLIAVSLRLIYKLLWWPCYYIILGVLIGGYNKWGGDGDLESLGFDGEGEGGHGVAKGSATPGDPYYRVTILGLCCGYPYWDGGTPTPSAPS